MDGCANDAFASTHRDERTHSGLACVSNAYVALSSSFECRRDEQREVSLRVHLRLQTA